MATAAADTAASRATATATGDDADGKDADAAAPPPCHVLFRTKSSAILHSVPPTPSEPGGTVLFDGGPTTLHAFAPDGSRVLLHSPTVGVVMRDLTDVPSSCSRRGGGGADGGDGAFLADSRAVQFATYSPRGTYVLTWERPSASKSTKSASTSSSASSSSPPPNLKVWRGSDGKYLHGYHLRNLKREAWPPIKWTHDERLAFHGVTNELHVYAGNAFLRGLSDGGDGDGDDEEKEKEVRYDAKVRCQGYTTFDLPTECADNLPTSPPPGRYLLSTFVPETKGKPARISLLRYPDRLGPETPGGSGTVPASKSFYQAEECTIRWSPRGDSALVLTHTTVDASGESYYGSTNLYLLLGDDGRGRGDGEAVAVPLPHQSQGGPVLDVQWNPNPLKPPNFAVTSGRMPAMSSLHHGTNAEPLFLFGNSHRNALSWSPHGRFLNLGGFGNLAGGMDFWDRNKLKKVPRYDPRTGAAISGDDITANCAVGYGWAPSGRYFIVSTTSPRMNVDNGVRMYTYGGVEVTDDPNVVSWDNANFRPDRLIAAQFVPAARGVHPDRPQSPPPKKRAGGEAGEEAVEAGGDPSAPPASAAAAAAAATAPAPYVPPAGRYVPPAARRAAGGGGGGGGTSLADRMRKERESATTGATRVVKKPGGVVGMSGGPPSSRKSVPVGMAAASNESGGGGKSKNALRRERQRLAREKREEADRVAAAAEEEERKKKKAAAEAEAAAGAAAAAPVDPEKRAKKIKKLLKQIDELRGKDASSLNDDQRAKVGTEESLRRELSGLGL